MKQTGENIAEDEKYTFLTRDFAGGMRRNVPPSKLDENEYALLVNGRSRYGTIKGIKLPKNLGLTEIPAGKFQGLYGIDSILVVFKDGKLWARDYAQPVNAFNQDPNFQMLSTATRIYSEAVPASWLNIQRKASSATDDKAPVLFNDPVAGTPQALVCQDGESRPRLVFSVGSSRPAHTEDEWKNDELAEEDTREYVPRGLQMLYHDSILYIVSPDGKRLFRSVTGRPLDYIVAIDQDGNKLPKLTSGGEEAERLHYAIDGNPITALRAIPAPQPTDSTLGPPFFVGTLKSSWAVFPDFSEMLFNEPTFTKIPLFPTGPLNQESVNEVLGDTSFIAQHGPSSFQSVQTLANEGINGPFYDSIYKLFEGVVQDITASFTFDNYGLYAVNTVYGYGVLVYDTQRSKFVALDLYPEVVGGIFQFAEIKVAGRRRLFFVTPSQLFEAFAGTETATVQLYCREFENPNIEVQLIPRRYRITLRDIEESGTISLTPFVDGLRGTVQSQAVTANIIASSPLQVPFGPGDKKTTVVKTFGFELANKGRFVGCLITMNFLADLIDIEPITAGEQREVSDDEAGLSFAENKTL
jgi:hypothetical protein